MQSRNVNDFLSVFLGKTELKKEKFKVILTQYQCDAKRQNGHVGDGNANVYLKHINNVCKMLFFSYGASNIVIVDDSE